MVKLQAAERREPPGIALGRPVWAMLSFAPDWRWLLDRDDSPWYPSLRLFRQPTPGDWDAVVANVRRALAELTAQSLPDWQPASGPQPKEEPPETPILDAQLAYDVAMGHYAAGRIDMTGAAAKEILASHPNHAGAQHLIGLVEIHGGRHQDAVDLLRRALDLDPNVGRVHNNLGIALAALGRRDEAIASFQRAVTCDPGLVDAHCNLGVLLRAANRLDEAADSFHRAIAAKPDNAEAHRYLGQTLKRQGQFDAAIESYRRAVTAKPDHADACNELGIVLSERGRADEAADSFRRAIAARPDHPAAHNNLGTALLGQDRLAEAVECFSRAILAAPDFADAHSGLGMARQQQNRLDDALESYRRCLRFQPDYLHAHVNLGFAHLVLGDFANGWREYEWRCRLPERPPRRLPQPLWAGEDIAGKTILIYREQGLGDTIQFLRYVPLVAARGARVVLEVQPALAGLAGRVEGAAEVIGSGTEPPACDVHCPLLSLPERFGTRLDTIPGEVPYLWADPAATMRWRQQLSDTPGLEVGGLKVGGLKVGLVWAGNPVHKNDRNRSIALERLLPMLEAPGVRWFSLQVGERAGDLARLPAGRVTDLSASLTDLAETAAVIANLDLVLAVDTAIVHLAGALGRPCWMMLPFAPDWRWLLDRTDSPWYPTLRLFRQPAPGDWDTVIAEVREALAGLIGDTLSFDADSAFAAATADYVAGRLDQAEAAAQRISMCFPAHAGAHHLIGVVELSRGRHQSAADLLQRAIALDPNAGAAHSNLGVALSCLGKRDEAVESFRRAVARSPGLADAHFNLGRLLCERKQHDQAIGCFRQAIRAKSDYLAAYVHLAIALTEVGELDEAAENCRYAIALDPDRPEIHFNLGTILQGRHAQAEAADCYRRALAVKPDYALAHYNLASLLQAQGDFAGALACFEQATEAEPNFASAHWNSALLLLRLGHFEKGWREYGWRWSANTGIPRRHADRPLWDGADLEGRTLLLHTEQGLGDTIQFVRYLPFVLARGGKTILETQPALARLIADSWHQVIVVGEGEELPPFDVQCPLLTLPQIFGTTLATIPRDNPYLRVDRRASRRWEHRLAPPSGVRVGLVWAGDPRHKNDGDRSIPVAMLAPLLQTAGVRWFSLQVGDRAAELSQLPAGSLDDLSRELTSFGETAAALANLDLVITVDTAVAHLAGALGKSVWVLLSFVTDWRWLLERSDSPWYPTMRLFRQPVPGDWDSVVAEIARELDHVARQPNDVARGSPAHKAAKARPARLKGLRRDHR